MEKSVASKIGEMIEAESTGAYDNIIATLDEAEKDGIEDGWGNSPKITSPIEQLFYGTYLILSWVRYKPALKLEIFPQHKNKSTGRYRFDFVFGNIENGDSVGIELDSHAWHEKKPEQVEAEKKRERYLVSRGWKILRFSGREVYRDPMGVVREALDSSWKLTNEHKQ